MVLPIPILLMYSIQPTLSLRTYNCCSGPPNIWALGPPPKPPWLKYKLDCNAKGIKIFENSSINLKESTAALQDSTSTIQGLSETTFISLESTSSSDADTGSFLSSTADLTTVTTQQKSFTTNPGATEHFTTSMSLASTQVEEITSDVQNDETSTQDATTSNYINLQETTTKHFLLPAYAISTSKTYQDIETTAPTELTESSSDRTGEDYLRDISVAPTTNAILPNTVNLSNESLMPVTTQDYTDANDTQLKESNNAADNNDKVLGDLTVIQLVILIICMLLLIVVLIILVIYVKRKYKATVKPDIVKDEETNYLYNYRVLGRAWRGRPRQTSWRHKKTTGPEDHRYLVNGTATPSSTLSLASNETETAQIDLDDDKDAAGTRRSSTSSGIGTSQGDSGAEAGTLRSEFSALPILAPIKCTVEPDKSNVSRMDNARYVIPQRSSRESCDSAQNAVVSLPNPSNWNVSEERTSAEHRHGSLVPMSRNTADENQPKKKRKKKRTNPSTELKVSEQNVPLQTISNGRLHTKLKLSPIPDVSGESQA